MPNEDLDIRFRSPHAALLERFVREKRACGYRYREGARLLARFDRFLCSEQEALPKDELPGSVTRKWLAKQSHESASTHQHRICIVRQFAAYLCRLGYRADLPGRSLGAMRGAGFSPRILTRTEVNQLLHTADQLAPSAHAPLRHLIMPEVFRLLYGCGLRLSEVLRLRVVDVDLDRGVLTVRETKFGKDRLVPPAPALVRRLRAYAAALGDRAADAFFFPSSRGGRWSIGAVYWLYRELLLRCGIAHAGRGKGPRLHDLRHAFAVHTLLRWYREGAKLDARLPVLATYLGHQSLAGTQRYLHLTAELYPELIARSNLGFGDVIPRGIAS